MAITFPNSDFDSVDTLLGAMGSFWVNINEDGHLRSLQQNRLISEIQNDQTYSEIRDSISRLDCPIYNKKHWGILTLYESKIAYSEQARLRYNALEPELFRAEYGATRYGEITYGAETTVGIMYNGAYVYGDFLDNIYAYDSTTTIKQISFLFDKLMDPDVILVEGTDFTLSEDGTALIFSSNPFDTLDKVAVYNSDGEITDYTITLWLGPHQIDTNMLYTQWGYLTGIEYSSSEYYKEFINAVFDAITGVASDKDISRVLSASVGVAVTKSDNETVTDIQHRETKLFIITDKNAYSFASTLSEVVAIGDVLNAGDPLVDAVEVIELISDRAIDAVIADPVKWPSLTLDNTLLPNIYKGDLVFENKTVNTEWIGYTDGYPEVRFEVSGLAADVELFWANTFEKSKHDVLLAQYLSKYPNPEFIVNSVDDILPTVNPMEFILKMLFRNNTVLIRIKEDLFDNGLGQTALSVLRKMIPPHILYITVLT